MRSAFVWGLGARGPQIGIVSALSSHSTGNRGAARLCARHSPSKGPAPPAGPGSKHNMSGAGPVSARTFRSRPCTGPLSYGGRCAAAFRLAARRPTRTGGHKSRPPGPRYKRPGACLGLDVGRAGVVWRFPPAPADRPRPWLADDCIKGLSKRRPPWPMPGPKA